MQIECIFEEIKDKLFVAVYGKRRKSVLDVLQSNWSNVMWLQEFFDKNESDLKSSIWRNVSVDEAVEITINEATEFLAYLKSENGEILDEVFVPLDNREYRSLDFQKLKGKGKTHNSWLRIYAVKYFDGYVITGGAIKLTHKMEDRVHTKKELLKLESMRNRLKLNEAEELFVYLDI